MPWEDQQPSDTAWALGRVAQGLSLEGARDLELLLAHSIGTPKPATLRQARLGLLVELVADRTGLIPGTADYERARSRRAESGESGWPSVSTLTEAYGSWPATVRAAMRLDADGTDTRVTHSPPKASPRRFSAPEGLRALRQFHEAHGSWPRSAEWSEWVRTNRLRARRLGRPAPRIPHHQTMQRLFGSFDRAIALAECDASSAPRARQAR